MKTFNEVIHVFHKLAIVLDSDMTSHMRSAVHNLEMIQLKGSVKLGFSGSQIPYLQHYCCVLHLLTI